MSSILFRCPQTGREIEPGIDGAGPEGHGAAGVRFVALHIRCPHCGEHHEIKIDEDGLEEAA